MFQATILAILTAGVIIGYAILHDQQRQIASLARRNQGLQKRLQMTNEEVEVYKRLYALAKKRTLTKYLTPHPRHEERAGWRLN
jgi:cell division protein FtsB